MPPEPEPEAAPAAEAPAPEAPAEKPPAKGDRKAALKYWTENDDGVPAPIAAKVAKRGKKAEKEAPTATPAPESPAAEAAPDAPPPDAAKPEPEADKAPKDKLSTAWAALKREKRETRRREEALVAQMQAMQGERAELDRIRAEVEAITAAVKGDPIAFVRKQGMTARELLAAAAKEDETSPADRKIAGYESALAEMRAEIAALKTEHQTRTAQVDAAAELAELAGFIAHPPEDVDLDGLQWFSQVSPGIVGQLHEAYVKSNRRMDLLSELQAANRWCCELRARALEGKSPQKSNGTSSPRGNGAVETAHPAAPTAPPALSNAAARRPTGDRPLTRDERRARAVELLDVRRSEAAR